MPDIKYFYWVYNKYKYFTDSILQITLLNNYFGNIELADLQSVKRSFLELKKDRLNGNLKPYIGIYRLDTGRHIINLRADASKGDTFIHSDQAIEIGNALVSYSLEYGIFFKQYLSTNIFFDYMQNLDIHIFPCSGIWCAE